MILEECTHLHVYIKGIRFKIDLLCICSSNHVKPPNLTFLLSDMTTPNICLQQSWLQLIQIRIELGDKEKSREENSVYRKCMYVGAPAPCWETVSRSRCDSAVTLWCSAGSQLHLFHGLNRNSAVSTVVQSRQDAFLPTYSWNIISHTLPFHLLRPPQNRKPFKNPFMLLAECYAFWLRSVFFFFFKSRSKYKVSKYAALLDISSFWTAWR